MSSGSAVCVARAGLRCWLLFWLSCLAEMGTEQSPSPPLAEMSLCMLVSLLEVFYAHTAPALHEEGCLSYKSVLFKH